MEAWAVMKLENDGSRRLDVAWPTKAQAEQAAGFCSYPVEVVPVWIEGVATTSSAER